MNLKITRVCDPDVAHNAVAMPRNHVRLGKRKNQDEKRLKVEYLGESQSMARGKGENEL